MSAPSRSIAFIEGCSKISSGKSSLWAYLSSYQSVIDERQLIERGGVLNECVERSGPDGSPSSGEQFFDSRWLSLGFLIHMLQNTIAIIGHGFYEPLLSALKNQEHSYILNVQGGKIY